MTNEQIDTFALKIIEDLSNEILEYRNNNFGNTPLFLMISKQNFNICTASRYTYNYFTLNLKTGINCFKNIELHIL